MIWTLVILAVSAPTSAYAKAAMFPLPRRVAASDVVAIVRISAIRPNRPHARYHRVAHAQVLRLLKGPAHLRALRLEFENGLICPNVLYERGETCLVFLTREDTGAYQTLTSYNGKYSVKDGTVEYWPEAGRSVSVRTAMAQIRGYAGRRR